MTWTTKVSLKMFLPARLFPMKFPRAGLAIVPSISKIITSILFLTLLAYKEIYNTSAITIQLMVNLKDSPVTVIANVPVSVTQSQTSYFTAEWV